VLIPRSMLINVDFSDATLSDVRFSGSVIIKSNFVGAVLDHVETLGAVLKDSNFKNSEIKNTVFKRAQVVVADFSTTEFKNVVFESTRFSDVDFSDFDFSSIKINPGVAFADSLFVGSNIPENELPETDFTQKVGSTGECYESVTRIEYNHIIQRAFDLSGVCFIPGSSLSGLDFSKTDLSTVIFSMMTSFGDDSSVDDLNDLERMRAIAIAKRSLVGVDLDSTNFSNSNLSGKNLSLLIFTNANLSHTDLSGADLRYSDLTNADLTAADLTNANLMGADLTNADLTNADLSGANLGCINHPICVSDS